MTKETIGILCMSPVVLFVLWGFITDANVRKYMTILAGGIIMVLLFVFGLTMFL